MDVIISYEYDPFRISQMGFEGLARFVLEQEDCPDETEVSICFVENSVIARLNEEYRLKSGPTDVLSFECDGLGDEFDATEGEMDEESVFELGDVVIAPDVAFAQCSEYGNTLTEELELLLTHGLLHLCGYDHIEDNEAAEMESREKEILTKWRGRPS